MKHSKSGNLKTRQVSKLREVLETLLTSGLASLDISGNSLGPEVGGEVRAHWRTVRTAHGA